MKPFVIAAALLAAGPALAAESPLKICTNPDANWRRLCAPAVR